MRAIFRISIILLMCFPAAAAAADHSDTARAFVSAVNNQDREALLRSLAKRFYFRSQKWIPASDGAGFVLGSYFDRRAFRPGAKRNLLQAILTSVRIKRPEQATLLQAQDSFYREELRRAPAAWRRLILYSFLRGEGDVEHVAVVGIEPASGRVAGFYVN